MKTLRVRTRRKTARRWGAVTHQRLNSAKAVELWKLPGVVAQVASIVHNPSIQEA